MQFKLSQDVVNIAAMLQARKQTMATAESCTGGYIAHLITCMPGISSHYKGSIVSYANEAKEDILKVKHETLEEKGAVSEETVIQMVKGALDVLKTDYAVATSGIMGPDGATPGKPIGTTWIAAGNHKKIITQLYHFSSDRIGNIQSAATSALQLLHRFMQGNE